MSTRLLQDELAAQARSRGHATALVHGAERVSFAELEAASNRMARLLLAAGCRPGDRVGVMAEKSPAAVTVMIAALKAGCAYVPLDVHSPATRLARILRAAEPAAVLGDRLGVTLCEQLRVDGTLPAGCPVGALDAATEHGPVVDARLGHAACASQAADPVPRNGRSGDLAHILFTSGSTGEPKGVTITHANVLAFIDWAVPHFGIVAGDRISGHPPLHFDLSTFDVYGALRAGAELHLVPGHLMLPQQLVAFILEHRLVQWFSVPSAMTYIARAGALPADGFPDLRRVLWCGEVLPVPVLAQWMELIPGARFTNLYGPTEATIASSFHTVPEAPRDVGTPIPIGRPCGGEELIVLGPDGRPAADGETGELGIVGPGLSPGYWRDPASTERAFGVDPRPGATGRRMYRTGDLGWADADGVLQYVGRRDAQIKSRGYRIELGEVEAAVSAVPGVGECAVVAVTADDFSGTAICCAYTGSGDLVAIRTSLRAALPSYMLPTHWEQMTALPKNRNGKIDRPALTRRFAAAVSP